MPGNWAFLLNDLWPRTSTYNTNWYNNRVPTLPGKPGILSFTLPGNWSKRGKTWNFNSKLWKIWILRISYFQINLSRCRYKKSFTSMLYLNWQNKNSVIQSQINLGFHCFYLEITWKIHGIPCHQRSGSPESWPKYKQSMITTWLYFYVTGIIYTGFPWGVKVGKMHAYYIPITDQVDIEKNMYWT